MISISIITPVYNAELYLRKAVESAVILDEVGEVILVEDASPDQALELALALEQEYEKVKMFQHPDKGNHGAGASRNLGIQKATCDYVAFLDADDYYLPHRFKADQEVFSKYADCEGVYSCVGTHFYTEKAKQEFFNKGFGYQEQLTLSDKVKPEDLFSVLFHRHKSVKGEFHTNGITLRKEVFIKVGNFHTDLKLRQDIHLWRRLAGFCRLYAGEIKEPVAMRGIHAQNRMTVKEDHEQYQNLWWESLKKEFRTKNLDQANYRIFEQVYFNYLTASKNKRVAVFGLMNNVLKYPSIIRHSYKDFDFNFWKVFGKSKLTLSLISFKNRLIHKLRTIYHDLKRIKKPKLNFDFPIQSNHFHNKEASYYISANSKVMSSTLKVANNLEQANLKKMLVDNIMKRIGLKSKYSFFLIVRDPHKRLESYYNNFFGIRVQRLGETHFKLEYSHLEILNNLGYKVKIEDISYKTILSKLTYNDIVKILPKISNKDSHLIPQTYLLKWHYGKVKSKLKMDRILKMENEDDLSFISKELGIDISSKYNKSIDRDTSLDKDYLKIVQEVYKEDYIEFNYFDKK